jgi:hypothetical protein
MLFGFGRSSGAVAVPAEDPPAPDAVGPRQRAVQCVHCLRRFPVPPKAMILTCPACFRRVRVEDVIVSAAQHTPRLETCGRIVIRPRARVVAETVVAGMGLEVHGELTARWVTAERVRIGPQGRWTGDCTAASIVVDPGGTILGGRFTVRPLDAPGLGLPGAHAGALHASP